MDTSIISNQLGFTSSGNYYYGGGSLYNRSSYGLYWSRTPNGQANAYGLRLYSTYLYPRNNYDRGHGFTLRCLAR